MNSFADNPERQLIYYFDTSDHNEENWIYYNDQILFDETYLLTEGTPSISDTLEIGHTYLFKVTYTIAGLDVIDSCFTTYTCNMNLTDPEVFKGSGWISGLWNLYDG